MLDWPVAYNAWTRLIGMGGFHRKFVAEYIRPRKFDRILEIGCGPGTFVPFLSFAEYVGIDTNPKYIKLAQTRFPHCSFVNARVSDYTLPEIEHFDIVLACGVVHHLDDIEAGKLFRIARLALKTSGRLITHDGVYSSGQSLAAKAILNRDRGEFVRTEDAYRQLAEQWFSKVKGVVRYDLLWIPYAHMVMECSHPMLG
jgi:SAM-dependent methyltransferase